KLAPALLVASVSFSLILLGFSYVSPEAGQAGFTWQLVPLGVAWVVLLAAMYSFVAVTVSVSLGATTAPLPQALLLASRRIPRVIGWSILSWSAVLAGLLCLLLPGLYVALRLFPVMFVALFEPSTNPLKRSWELTRYRVLEVFLY